MSVKLNIKERPYWPDNTIYFLTGSTFLHYPYFKEYDQKQIVLNQIEKLRDNLGIDVLTYSIAINHYHLKFYLRSGLLLSKVKQIMHGGTSFEYRRRYRMKYKDMWQGSKVIRITSEDMDWMVTGYIIGNLLKHKEVNSFAELQENPFSSYRYIVEKHGEEFARELVYNVIDVEESGAGVIDIAELKNKRLKPL